MPLSTRPMSRKRKEIDTTTFSGKFAARLKQLREKKKMSVEELAERTGIPHPTLYRWESGDRCPVNEQIFLVASVLEIKVSRLLDGLDK